MCGTLIKKVMAVKAVTNPLPGEDEGLVYTAWGARASHRATWLASSMLHSEWLSEFLANSEAGERGTVFGFEHSLCHHKDSWILNLECLGTHCMKSSDCLATFWRTSLY